mmetsp:Transcript_9915/g.23668  ORF Transcript_9915/g.23668 Transcript_9915/m.23668 type:complete len:781 (-) Transcript_9915:317-2659(-)
MDGQTILLKGGESSTDAVGGSESSSSDTNILSPADSGAGSVPGAVASRSSSGPIILPPPSGGMSHSATPMLQDSITPSPTAERGLSGLNNLGNTCFMNTSLQCLSHTPPVVSFFVSNEYRRDINPDNPLGRSGELAEAFGSLMHSLWQGGVATVSPRGFKARLAHFAPQFSGYSQQDSQEVLAFLLDGLHEDLNRIRNKPYIEDKDSDGRPDEELAEEAWHNYRQRNDSVVVDHFQGLYKSCLVCPDCGKSSIKFDPFMYLSLPLPAAPKRSVLVTLVATDGSAPPTLLSLRVPKNGTVGDLRSALCSAAGIGPSEDVVLAEIAFHRVRSTLQDDYELRFLAPGPSSPLVAYRRPRPEPGAALREVHIFNAAADGPGGGSRLFAAPLLLWFPRSAEGEEDYTQEELHERLTKALRPLRRFRRRDAGSDSHGSSGCSKGSASAMAVDAAPSVTMSDAICHAESREDAMEDDGSSQRPEGDAGQALPMDCTDAPAAACSGPGPNIPRVEPFDMWAVARGDGAQPAGPTGDRAARKRSQPPFQLHPSSEFGTIGQGPPSARASPGRIDYYVLEWDGSGRDSYDAELLKFPRADEAEDRSGAHHLEEAPVTLASCLGYFLQHERLGEQDSWYCPSCKDHVQADKKLDLWSLPEVLVVHLKRFSYTTRLRDKIAAMVDFPLRGLDLSPHVLREQPIPPVYDLFAVSNHIGGLGGGHYTAYAKQPGTDRWHCFDDSRVYPIDEKQVVSADAYVLFYHRRNEATSREAKVQEVLRQWEATREAPVEP